jgi:hypothetical protein
MKSATRAQPKTVPEVPGLPIKSSGSAVAIVNPAKVPSVHNTGVKREAGCISDDHCASAFDKRSEKVQKVIGDVSARHLHLPVDGSATDLASFTTVTMTATVACSERILDKKEEVPNVSDEDFVGQRELVCPAEPGAPSVTVRASSHTETLLAVVDVLMLVARKPRDFWNVRLAQLLLELESVGLEMSYYPFRPRGWQKSGTALAPPRIAKIPCFKHCQLDLVLQVLRRGGTYNDAVERWGACGGKEWLAAEVCETGQGRRALDAVKARHISELVRTDQRKDLDSYSDLIDRLPRWYSLLYRAANAQTIAETTRPLVTCEAANILAAATQKRPAWQGVSSPVSIERVLQEMTLSLRRASSWPLCPSPWAGDNCVPTQPEFASLMTPGLVAETPARSLAVVELVVCVCNEGEGGGVVALREWLRSRPNAPLVE